MAWKGNLLGWEKNQDPSSAPERDWQDSAGGLLLVAAIHETGLLTHLETAVAPCLTQTSRLQLSPSLHSQRSLLLTLLFLNAVGLRRTRDLHGYTDEALGLLTGRRRAYGYWHTERFLTHLANAGGAEELTNARGRVDCNAMAIGRRAGSGLLRLHRWASQACVCRQADSSRIDWMLRQKDQVMTICKLALANVVMWTRDHYFPATYAHATWERLAPFFQLRGVVISTRHTVSVELRSFNDRQYNRDLLALCQRVNERQIRLPDGRLLVFSVKEACRPILHGQQRLIA